MSVIFFYSIRREKNKFASSFMKRHIFSGAERKPCYVTSKGGVVDSVLIVLQYNILLLWLN